MKVRGEDILIPTMMVGNYPNPRWYDGHAHAQIPIGDFIHDSIEKEAFYDAVLALAKDQEEAGLDIISCGRVYAVGSYGRILYHYIERMNGYQMFGPNIGLPIYSTLYAPTCVGKISRKGRMGLPILKALKRATNKPVKVSYTGIQVLAQATNNQFYPSARELALDIAKAINEDLLELDSYGVDYIQFDEFTWPYVIEDWAIEAFNTAVAGVKAKIILHICFGNYSGTPGYYPDGTAAVGRESFTLTRRKGDVPKGLYSVLPRAYEARFDVLNVEFGRRGFADLEALRKYPLPAHVDFSAGVIDVKNTITETAEEVAARIRKVLEYVPAEKLSVNTDCGMILLQRYVAIEKLKALVEGARLVREELKQRELAAQRKAS